MANSNVRGKASVSHQSTTWLSLDRFTIISDPAKSTKIVTNFINSLQVHLNEWQHFTMYSSFLISGVVDIISQKVLKKRIIIIERAFITLAFYITALLLFFHRHGKVTA